MQEYCFNGYSVLKINNSLMLFEVNDKMKIEISVKKITFVHE